MRFPFQNSLAGGDAEVHRLQELAPWDKRRAVDERRILHQILRPAEGTWEPWGLKPACAYEGDPR